MRIFGPSGVRNFPTDRNPLTIAQGTSSSQAGGTSTDHASYTVPAGRAALIEVANVAGVVTTVLGAAQTASVQVLVIPSGGASQTIAQGFLQAAAAVGTERVARPLSLQLDSGDQVIVRTVVNAGTGVVQGSGGAQGIEYDA